MYGVAMGIVWGLLATTWWFIVGMSVVHGIVMGVWMKIKKPDAVELAVDKKMEEAGTKAYSDEQVPVLEFVSELLICLIVRRVTFGIKLVIA